MGQDNHSGGDPREQNDDGGIPGIPPAPRPGGSPEWQPPQWNQPPQPQNPWNQPPQQNQWNQPGTQWNQPGGFPPHQPNQPWGFPGALPQGGWTPPPKPGIIPLRPLGLGELLDGAFQACRKNPAATFGTALLIQAVISLLTYLFIGSLVPDALFSPDFDDTDFESVESNAAWSVTGLSLLGVISVVGVLLLQGVLVVPLARSILNLKTGFAQTWRLCRSRLLALAGMGLLLTVAFVIGLAVFGVLVGLLVSVLGAAGVPVLILGFLALIAVFVWLGVKLAFAPAALVLEPAGIFASLRRSWQLTNRNFWRSFGILALTAILVSIISSVISVPVLLITSLAGAFGSGSGTDAGTVVALFALNAALTTFFSAIGYAFQAAVTSLLYVDLRIRREGFDLTLMKEQEIAGVTPDLVPGRHSGKPGDGFGGITPPGAGPAPYGGAPGTGYGG
ncbi:MULTISPECIES: glycerophosphoryl diester phosphodiesterase membrane domain-containing protein [unclassified Arthrobacter]|uniref:glycerophosphoryl diester phosphodiesterase membrane domain-containing protein n=1 Tax=unclassified Arthrobacter TaxID=235627 RepID=UPI000CE30789|nr:MULTISPECIES: glycerophosphoryl diester phosphodiesterase membrane domain-containing protein [unclassified Arthrobacter]